MKLLDPPKQSTLYIMLFKYILYSTRNRTHYLVEYSRHHYYKLPMQEDVLGQHNALFRISLS